MIHDALDVLRVLRGQLGREPSFTELLQALGHAPAGQPVAGPNDPGYPDVPGEASQLLGPVHDDSGLTALLRARDLREAHPDLERMRQELVRQLLYGNLPPRGPGLGELLNAPARQPMGLGHGGHFRPQGAMSPLP